jgi:hypothetical protein
METKNVNVASLNFVPLENAHIASVNLSPLEFGSRWHILNTKINSILGNHVLYDTDVRDLYTIMGELGIRDQWKEMNAKIRAELEGITKHVEEATKILDANPPQLEWRSYTAPVALAAAPVAVMPSFGFSSAMVAPTVEHMYRYEPVVFEEKRWGLEKPELISMPWQQWNCQVNTQVANADVKEIIPVKKQVVVRRLFGEWDALMEDVAEWHRRGLYRYNVRLCMAPQTVQYVQVQKE